MTIDCEYCNRTYSGEKTYKYHLGNNKRCLKIRGINPTFQCPSCKEAFDSKYYLNKHSCTPKVEVEVVDYKALYEASLETLKSLEASNDELTKRNQYLEGMVEGLTKQIGAIERVSIPRRRGRPKKQVVKPEVKGHDIEELPPIPEVQELFCDYKQDDFLKGLEGVGEYSSTHLKGMYKVLNKETIGVRIEGKIEEKSMMWFASYIVKPNLKRIEDVIDRSDPDHLSLFLEIKRATYTDAEYEDVKAFAQGLIKMKSKNNSSIKCRHDGPSSLEKDQSSSCETD